MNWYNIDNITPIPFYLPMLRVIKVSSAAGPTIHRSNQKRGKIDSTCVNRGAFDVGES